jgi:uncharacterized membrane protein
MLSIIMKDFIVGRPPASSALNPAIAYIASSALVIAALRVILQKQGTIACIVIAGLILLFSVSRLLQQFMNDWLNTYKALALLGGALIVAASCSNEDGNFRNNQNLQTGLLIAGRLLLAVFLIACGYAHFKFVPFIVTFIPDYLPFHEFWAYFCGVCLVAGGLGLLVPQTAKWAALLSGIMIGGWFLLLHIPRFIANSNDASDRMGLLESFTFTGIFLVLAGMLSRTK